MSLAYIRSQLPEFLGGSSSSYLIPEPPKADPKNPDAPPPIVAHRLDFVKLGLPEYEHRFAMVIDNLFTPEDCERYIAAAESAKEWEVAAVNGGPGSGYQYVDTSYRNSSRILLDDFDLTREMLERMRPYLKDIEHMDRAPLHGTYDRKTKTSNDPPAKLVALNERLRYLKYGPGQFFRRHCDGTYHTPDMKQISYYTLQLYLNGSAEELEGGATRFWRAVGRDRRKAESGQNVRQFVDVDPRVGRALIFEQKGLLHSGEDVKKGIKITVRTDLMFEACTEGDKP
ncbi:hypothetical protein FRC07_008998 [Ceratobasidium sp. 392]|nr:hypothetical protein FRC07_008998 [Ceratobasidium sp. 392]